jgi:DNA-binding response OmpR family regulator
MRDIQPMPQQNIDLLIVDDDTDLRELLHFYFSKLGYQTVAVNNGRDAIKLCVQNRPRLILLDIGLPGLDGHEVYQTIRAMPGTDKTAIIFLTQHNTRDDRLAALDLGADDFIGKPFDIQELRLRIQRRLGK